MSDREWQYGPPPTASPQPVVGIDPGSITGVAWHAGGEVYGIKDATLTPVTAEEIREVLAHVEVVETPELDLIASPGQVWVVEKEAPRSVTMEVELNEEQFWHVVEAVWGPAVVQEMKEELNDWLRWEGEGGPCLS